MNYNDKRGNNDSSNNVNKNGNDNNNDKNDIYYSNEDLYTRVI